MRVITWNTQWRFGDWGPRQELLRSQLVERQPDVVLLQETWPGQAGRLAAEAGLRVLGFGGGYFDQELSNVANDERFGNAVLATGGKVVVDAPFPSPGDPAPRHLVAVDIDGVVVAPVHLSHLSDGDDVRKQQLQHLVAELSATTSRFVLAGDCNLVPTSAEYRAALDLGLHDSWAELHGDALGPTMVPVNPEVTHTAWMNDRNGPSVPADTGVRLDYVWTSEPGMVRSIERFGSADGPRWPSDHLGLCFELATEDRTAASGF